MNQTALERASFPQGAPQFILRLEWTSADDHMQGFRKSEEFRRFFALVKPFYEDIQEMWHYERLLERAP